MPVLDNVGFGVALVRESGLLSLDGVRLIGAITRAARKYGAGPAMGFEASANAFGDAIGLYDDDGSLTFRELRDQSDALAVSLGERGVEAGSTVAILARNHRGLALSTVALNKLGADTVFLNTGFAGPQVVDVCARENVTTVIADQEFEGLVRDVAGQRFVSEELGQLIEEGLGRHPGRPVREARAVILTSGTTGTPKGASRDTSSAAGAALGFAARLKFKIRDTTLVGAPAFHAWGAAHLAAGMMLGSTVVLQRRFEPEAALAAIDMHRVRTFVVVPVMLQRILDLPADVRAKYDTSSLEVVASSGSALPGPLAQRWMDAFGDNLFNTYGSTEVSIATVADPQQLRAHPGTAGTALRGSTVVLLDEHGKPVPQGESGRIFVGNSALFDGYTGGGSKEMIDGMMSTGDMGHFDAEGNLFVDGRDDDMIVSGGENVFPAEVEDLIAGHPDVEEVAVVGVKDEQFGQRLAAYVVLRDGTTLTEEAVKDHVKAHLARHKVPRDVHFIDALPRNATGKIVRRQLGTDA
jgi:acyl-CoA synthetase (AMP-forming)/AMP-acid ligase II